MPLLERNTGEFYACITMLRPREAEEFLLCMTLHRLSPKSEQYIRKIGLDLSLFPKGSSRSFKYKSIYVMQPPSRADVPRAISFNELPSLVIVKTNIGSGQGLQCHWSSWISMDQVVASRFGSSLEPRDSETIRIPTKGEDDGVYKYRLNKLVNSTMSFNREEMLALTLDNSLDQCWFSDAESSCSYSTTGIRGVLCFGSEAQPESVFLIALGLFEERPLCNAVLTTLKESRDRAKQASSLEEHQTSPLQRDRVTIHTKEADCDKAPATLPDVETTISIRRMATAPNGIRRFMLSINQRNVPIRLISQRRTPTIGTLDSWDRDSILAVSLASISGATLS